MKKSSKSLAPSPEQAKPERPSINFNWPADGKEKPPEILGNLSLGDKVTVTVTGMVKSISLDSWSSSFSITKDSVAIQPVKVAALSMKEAMREVGDKRKM